MKAFAPRADAAPPPGAASAGTERWVALEALFQQTLARPPAERRAHLDATCRDAGVRAEVESLLAAHERRGMLDELVDEVMTPLLARREPVVEPTAAPPMHSRYRMLERLGGGGMGVVYRARDERLGRDVALKFLPPHLSADQAAKKRFMMEARAAAALEHPNICTVHEIGDTDDGQLYIVMACYEGETLDRHIARGPLAVDEAIRVTGEIARGLAKAHERGIVHRDIKPANVMVTGDGLVKVLDFGIAKLADVSLTQTARAVGTVAYMSPEQAFGEVVDHRTDIWSLGVVLYEMLTGVRPFRGPGEQAVLVAALTAEPEPVTSLRADVPAEMDEVIRRALAKRPAERFASVAKLLAALAACPASTLVGVSSGAAAGGVERGVERRDGEPRDTALTRGGERRQVTVVACAMAGYDALVERLSPEDVDRVLARIRATAAEVATYHGGIVNHFSGDGLVMLFGVPTAHEDDAVRAVRAALALHARVADVAATLDERVSAGLRLHSGVHVGPVVAQRLREGDRRYRITGAPADVATRLAAAAEPDVILVSPETRRLVDPFVHTAEARAVALQADGALVAPYRVLGASDVRSRLEGAVRAGLTPFVGRERERAALAEHLASAREGQGRFTVLVGEAGAGKSRLLHELRGAAASAGTRVLAGRCDAYGVATPFLPFVEAAHEALGLPGGGTLRERHDAVVAAARAVDDSLEEFLPLYLALLAIPSEAHPVPEHLHGELFRAAMLEAVAALFTLGARSAPTLLLLEDWHWADEASRAALRQLAEIVPAFPLLLVVTSRPDGTADWGSADHQTLLHLAPLDGLASAAIAGAVLGAQRVAPELVARLHERTGGNPFFLEEVCEALREAGALAVRDGEVVAANASGAVHVPETVQAVLRTRIDRLDDEARDALRLASVMGREFTRGVLEDVAAPESGLARALERLKASGLVQQVGVVPDPAYRFKHALTQEVAYDSLLEHQRATLHASVARAMERRYAARLDEHVERLAHHFSRAESWAEAVR
ncbi:MAG TPA: BREX system ATP-binding domain-containing protein, partial [Gemmatimonadaceae bacterium]|nr:BREX system ATP-binding domain-containing protein [Gemmatimonadaceae bacterium]